MHYRYLYTVLRIVSEALHNKTILKMHYRYLYQVLRIVTTK